MQRYTFCIYVPNILGIFCMLSSFSFLFPSFFLPIPTFLCNFAPVSSPLTMMPTEVGGKATGRRPLVGNVTGLDTTSW